jgi:hypothetical protein
MAGADLRDALSDRVRLGPGDRDPVDLLDAALGAPADTVVWVARTRFGTTYGELDLHQPFAGVPMSDRVAARVAP